MRFTYVYRKSDGVRVTDTIDAESRDEAFSALRKVGIRPIKVIADDGSKENGEVRKGVRRRVVFAVSIVSVIVGAVLAIVLTGPEKEDPNRALPMTRRQIHAGYERANFKHVSEAYLANYAIPGKIVEKGAEISEEVRKDFEAAADDPIVLSSDDDIACSEIKSIVAGMKEELRMFLASGGTIDEYILRLEERQKMEIAYREQAALKLEEVRRTGSSEDAFREWKAQNAWLQAMGIERLAMPEEKDQNFDLTDEESL